MVAEEDSTTMLFRVVCVCSMLEDKLVSNAVLGEMGLSPVSIVCMVMCCSGGGVIVPEGMIRGLDGRSREISTIMNAA